jgi:sugar/nucleoside kinase (ribokinase family)
LEEKSVQKYHIYGLGAALVDTEIKVSDRDLQDYNIDKGVMTLVDEARQHQLMVNLADHLAASRRTSGGSAANTVIAASYFGADTFYSCKVANDDNGRFYLSDMRSAGVELAPGVDQNDGITGKCLVMITPDAERTMNTFLGVSETVSTEQLYQPAVQSSQYVYIEGYLATSETGRHAAIRLRNWAEKHGVKTSMSLSDPAVVEFFRDDLQHMIGDHVNLLFCNRAEALSFTNSSTIEQAVEILKSIADEFAITLGDQGALLYDGRQFLEIATCKTNAVDTNGAGDMFAGAFLYAITHGYSRRQAGELASAAAAQVVSQFGPRLRPEQHGEILTKVFTC